MAIEERLQGLIRTSEEMANLQGATLAARVLAEARPSLVHSGYDNWNGGTEFYTLVLEVPLPTYVEIEPQQGKLEDEIKERIRVQTRTETNETVSEVVISPVPVEEVPFRQVQEPGASETSEPVPTFWQPGYFRLFISHLTEQKVTAHALKDALASFQIAAFVAHDDIQPSTEWQNEIETALRTMDAMTAILAPGFVNSPWCDQEVGYALGRRRFVLGLRAGADPHGFLGKFQGLNVSGLNVQEAASLIFEVLMKHEATTQRMTESLVERIIHSSSWDSSKRTVTLLEKATFLNSGQVARLLESIRGNVDVRDAFGVPEKLRGLVSRIGESSS